MKRLRSLLVERRAAIGRAAAGGLALALLAVALAVIFTRPPSFAEVRAGTRGSEALLVDRAGEPLQRLRLDRTRRQLEWIALADISPALRRAIVESEDRRFAWHAGVDPIGVLAALRDNISRQRARGASTITMQLAGLLGDDRPGHEPRTFGAKLAQARDALAIEARWSKDEILEAYLNLASFRGELRGVDAAARGLFRKAPAGLDRVESAILASLVRAPAADATRVAARACGLLSAAGEASRCDRASLVAAGLPRRNFRVARGVDDAPHLARRLLTRPGETVRSTLDARLQRFARDALREQLRQLTGRNVEDGAIVVLDNASGEVLAYVGSSGDLSDAAEVDGVIALRHPGSTLKPFLYGVAIERGWLTAASVLDDGPVALTTPSGLYIPQNYDRDFKGAVSVRTALGASLNVPAVRALALVGVDRFVERLRGFGLRSLVHDGEHYGFGLALGGAEVDLVALTNAYRAIANGGEWRPVAFAPETPDPLGPLPVRVLTPEAAFIVADMLADPAARAITFGFASALSTRVWSAVKTGTSKAMRDNWAVGFTDRYTVGVWVGNFSGEPMWDVSGTTGAAPVWQAIVEHLHADRPSRAPAAPEGVARTAVRFAPAIEAEREEWFVKGTETARVQVVAAKVKPAITTPASGTFVAVDPDVPPDRQMIVVRSSGAGPGDCLWLDRAPLGRCGAETARVPLPPPGRHRIELRDASGARLDVAEFTVRGIVRARP